MSLLRNRHAAKPRCLTQIVPSRPETTPPQSENPLLALCQKIKRAAYFAEYPDLQTTIRQLEEASLTLTSEEIQFVTQDHERCSRAFNLLKGWTDAEMASRIPEAATIFLDRIEPTLHRFRTATIIPGTQIRLFGIEDNTTLPAGALKLFADNLTAIQAISPSYYELVTSQTKIILLDHLPANVVAMTRYPGTVSWNWPVQRTGTVPSGLIEEADHILFEKQFPREVLVNAAYESWIFPKSEQVYGDDDSASPDVYLSEVRAGFTILSFLEEVRRWPQLQQDYLPRVTKQDLAERTIIRRLLGALQSIQGQGILTPFGEQKLQEFVDHAVREGILINTVLSPTAAIMPVRFEHPVTLEPSVWPKRVSIPFTAEEELLFASDEGLTELGEFHLDADQVQEVSHSTYNRQDSVTVRARVIDNEGKRYLLQFPGTDTSALGKLKNLMDPFEKLSPADSLLSVSAGNQGDLPGNFTLLSEAGRWVAYSGNNEKLFQRSFRAMVQEKSGRRQFGTITLEGDPQTNDIRRVKFIPARAPTISKTLRPDRVSFVIAAYFLHWVNTPAPQLLEEQYTADSDLRHVFALPYHPTHQRNVFYEQLVNHQASLRRAFHQLPISFQLMDYAGQPLDVDWLTTALEQNGYKPASSVDRVLNPGDYVINGATISIILLPAFYPLNLLAFSEDGESVLSLNVLGQSGRVGANSWTIGRWVQKHWGPYPFVMVTDHGMDPQVTRFENGIALKLVSGGRGVVNMALNFTPRIDSTQWHHASKLPYGNASVLSLAKSYRELLVDGISGPIRYSKDAVLLRLRVFSNQVREEIQRLGSQLDRESAASLKQRLDTLRDDIVATQSPSVWHNALADLEDVLNRELFLPFAHRWVFIRSEDGRHVLLDDHPAAWWRLKLRTLDVLVILWPSDVPTAYSHSKQVLIFNADDLVQMIRMGLQWWSVRGTIFPLEQFVHDLTYRFFYEELGHVQDSQALDAAGDLQHVMVKGSPLESWAQKRWFGRNALLNDVFEIAAFFRHFILARTDQNRQEALLAVTTQQDFRHASAAQFVQDQFKHHLGRKWKTRLDSMNLPGTRQLVRNIMAKNLRLATDGGLLPTLSDGGHALQEHPSMQNILHTIINLLLEVLDPQASSKPMLSAT